MSRTKWLVGSLVLLGVVCLVAVPVYAHCGKCTEDCKKMVTKMDEAKITLSKAIEVAEKESKGKAVKAVAELEKDALGIEVYCMAGDKLMEVKVDPKTGKVTSSKEVKDTGEAGHEHDAKGAEKPKAGGW